MKQRTKDDLTIFSLMGLIGVSTGYLTRSHLIAWIIILGGSAFVAWVDRKMIGEDNDGFDT